VAGLDGTAGGAGGVWPCSGFGCDGGGWLGGCTGGTGPLGGFAISVVSPLDDVVGLTTGGEVGAGDTAKRFRPLNTRIKTTPAKKKKHAPRLSQMVNVDHQLVCSGRWLS
jgi:hypothetical protein